MKHRLVRDRAVSPRRTLVAASERLEYADNFDPSERKTKKKQQETTKAHNELRQRRAINDVRSIYLINDLFHVNSSISEAAQWLNSLDNIIR